MCLIYPSDPKWLNNRAFKKSFTKIRRNFGVVRDCFTPSQLVAVNGRCGVRGPKLFAHTVIIYAIRNSLIVEE